MAWALWAVAAAAAAEEAMEAPLAMMARCCPAVCNADGSDGMQSVGIVPGVDSAVNSY